MSSQWNTRSLNKNISVPGVDDRVLGEEVVILMNGINTFGDRIYSYLKITVADFARMQSSILSGKPFNPSDFGSVVAAGKGEPTDEIKHEVASMYNILDPTKVTANPSAPPSTQQVASKAWDDY